MLVFLTGLPGNILVIIVETKEKNKSSTDWFVLALAVCDVVSLSFNIPVFFLAFTSLWRYVGSTIGCKLHTYVHFLTYLASALMFAAIGFDSYTKICRPHSVYLTTARAKRASIAIAVISAVLTFHHLFLSGLDADGHCVFQKYKLSFSKFEQIIGGLIIITVSVFVSVTYILVYRRMQSLRKRVSPLMVNSTKDHKSNSNNKFELQNSTTNKKITGQTSASTSKNTVPLETFNRVPKIESMKRASCTDRVSLETRQNAFAISEQAGSCSKECGNEYKTETEKQGALTSRIDNRHCSHDRVSKQTDNTRSKSVPSPANNTRTTKLKSTTKIMAFASMFYVICTLLRSITSAVWTSMDKDRSQISTTIALMVQLLYCIKLSVNPYFYVAMSSRFRAKTLEIFKGTR
jgi:cell division protein FtsL